MSRATDLRLTDPALEVWVDVRLRRINRRWLAVADLAGTPDVGISTDPNLAFCSPCGARTGPCPAHGDAAHGLLGPGQKREQMSDGVVPTRRYAKTSRDPRRAGQRLDEAGGAGGPQSMSSTLTSRPSTGC